MMYHLKTAWTHIRRSPYQTTAAILTMTLTFFVASMFFITAAGFQSVLKAFEKQPQITVFFQDSKSEEDIRLLDEKLKLTGKVEKSVYISKNEALKIYQDQNKNDPLLLEMVTADILPASLEVSAIDPKFLGELAQVIEIEAGVEDVIYQKDVIDTMVAWIGGVRTIGMTLVIILLIVSLLVLLTVITLKIALKRDEIEILQLLGASSWYIRGPFVLEGVVYGVISSIFAWGATYITYLYTSPFIRSLLTGIDAFSFSPLFMLFLLLGMILVSIILSALGSLIALSRYL